MKHLLLSLSLVTVFAIGYSQQPADTIRKHHLIHLHIKAFKNGKNLFELYSRKETVYFRYFENKQDTTIHFEWNKQLKHILTRAVTKGNVLKAMKALSIPKPDDLEKTQALVYMNLHIDQQKEKLWAKISQRKNDRSSRKLEKFVGLLMQLFKESPVKNINKKDVR